jgi:NADH-quinone oxidoreductase subunit N
METKLNQLLHSLPFVLPEIWLAFVLILLIIIDLFSKKSYLFYITFIGLSIELVLIYCTPLQDHLFLFVLSADSLSVIFKYLLVVISLAILLIIKQSKHDNQLFNHTGEFYAVLVAILFGMNILTMSTNLLMIYLALEIVSIGSYILAVLHFDRKGVEISLKYTVFGIFSSAIMLYGMSLLYGFSGSLDLIAISQASKQIPDAAFLTAFVLSIGGFLFKISASPFHIWTPDVYEGAPTTVVAFLSTASKVAGFAILSRFALAFQPDLGISNILIIIAIASLLIGNFSALWQTSFKRLLAYSGIAQAGFVLVGLITLNTEGVKMMIFYLVTYTIANLIAFLGLILLESAIKKSQIDAGSQIKITDNIQFFSGLGTTSFVFGLALSISMISLVGLPITAGFTAKLLIFTQLWQSKTDTSLLILLVAGLLSTAISLYFYLQIPYYLFFKPKIENLDFQLTTFQKVLMVLLSLALLVLFFKPEWLLNLINI